MDKNGELIEIDKLVGVNSIEKKAEESKGKAVKNKRNASIRLRNFLGQFALYRRFKRSAIAMWIATHWKVGDQSLWPGLDTALKIDPSEDDTYRWTLAEKLIHQIGKEAGSQGVKVVLVNIPYLAQVYDDVWDSSFGTAPEKYDRWIAGKKLREICERGGVYYIDTTTPIIDEVKKTGKWLHHPEDAHPTAQGHEVIANTIASELRRLNLIQFKN